MYTIPYMLKDFFVKAMLKRQGVSDEQVDMVLAIVNKNPQLFQTIAAEVQAKVSGGMEQSRAMMEVMKLHEEELRALKP